MIGAPASAVKMTLKEAKQYELDISTPSVYIATPMVLIGWLWGPCNSGRQGRSRWVYTNDLHRRTYGKDVRFIPVYTVEDG